MSRSKGLYKLPMKVKGYKTGALSVGLGKTSKPGSRIPTGDS